MEENYFTDKEMGPDEIQDGMLPKGEYDNCMFRQLDLSGKDLSGYVFMDCRFEACNLGNVKLQGTAMKTVGFSDCKLTGLQFADCHPFLFAVSFQDCRLEYSSFHGLAMKGTSFVRCQMTEVDLTEADLSGAGFDGTDLAGAQFGGANLEKADLRKATRYTIDPRTTKLKKAMFSLHGLPGLLAGHGIIIEP